MPRLPTPPCSQAPLGASCCCCKRCNYGGCDLRVVGCGCCFHARCCPVSIDKLLTHCPICGKEASVLLILPMVFDELDIAQQEAVSCVPLEKRGRKRKMATIARFSSAVAAEESLTTGDAGVGLRSGRWTDEETDFCDKLIELFEQGKLPIPDGIKLNDFLSNVLKSKQSRLTKKMKNAKLSARQYKRETGTIDSNEVAIAFSRLETDFIASIKCNMERSEIKFHMQKEWRELFSSYCVSIGQKVDAHAWMKSVEELDRRVSMQNDAARIARRKLMMGQAFEKDMEIGTAGVFIDATISPTLPFEPPHTRNSPPPTNQRNASSDSNLDLSRSSSCSQLAKKKDGLRYYSSPLIKRLMQYIQRHNVPFEHVDVWAPSFTGSGGHGLNPNGQDCSTQQSCRLFFAGFGTMESRVPDEGGSATPMTSDEIFDLLSFGEYSEKFSFDVGCGVPGRVYSSGVASWEQGIQNAPKSQFERLGGAQQWAIQTVLGIPVPSPNVERIVVLFYSKFDRPQNMELMMPTPRWNLVVDIGVSALPLLTDNTKRVDIRSNVLNLIDFYMPKDKDSPLAVYLPGFTSLRLLLVQEEKSDKDEEFIEVALGSFLSYRASGRSDADVVALTARDFMVLTKKDVRASVTVGSNMIASCTEEPQYQRTNAFLQPYETNEFPIQLLPEPNDVGIPCCNNSTGCGLPSRLNVAEISAAPVHQFDNRAQNLLHFSSLPIGLLSNDQRSHRAIGDDFFSLNSTH